MGLNWVDPFEDVSCFLSSLSKRWEDKKEDDKDEEEKRSNVRELLAVHQLMVADSEKGCEEERGAENMAVSEREPIVFGVLSEFLPICVVTLDFRSFGSPCHAVRELLKEKLWTQSPQILDQLIILYYFFKLRDTSLQLIECRGAIQFYVQVYSLKGIEKITADVESRGFSDILTCMFLSGNIKSKMEMLSAQFSVTCHCESLEQWKRDLRYGKTRGAISFFKPATGSPLNTLYLNWPSSSISNSGSSEESKVSKATVHNHWISQDSEWSESSISVGQKITYEGKPAGVAQDQCCSRGHRLRGRGRGHILRSRGLGRGRGRGRGRNLTSEVGAEASLPYL
ncbi:hypothetical protein HOLleu_16590 [Holothuria leucospilota]|uniref:Uncharacterized protein n=1 Tax=Holothuria leucospilota TaxID=206669 RepID=A0A9Q1C6F3_HOLLE|nr:hypothetical protein HOLleu_16590 [Holothuria leucospilota]